MFLVQTVLAQKAVMRGRARRVRDVLTSPYAPQGQRQDQTQVMNTSMYQMTIAALSKLASNYNSQHAESYVCNSRKERLQVNAIMCTVLSSCSYYSTVFSSGFLAVDTII